MFPFFSRRAGRWVTGEKCLCGHTKSEHGSRLIRGKTCHVRQPNEGGCTCDCSCKNFTWAGWVYAPEPVEVEVPVEEVEEDVAAA